MRDRETSIEDQLKNAKYDLEKAREALADVRKVSEMRRLILLGMVADKFTLTVHLNDPAILKDGARIVSMLVGQYAKETAYEIEKRIGWTAVELRDALLHINYLENHAARNGVQFHSWGWRSNDRRLMDGI